MEKEACGKKRGLKETECVGRIAKNWILGERKIGRWGVGGIPAYDSNLFFNFEASTLQILKFPKNLYVSRFFCIQLSNFIFIHPPCVSSEKVFLATIRTAIIVATARSE